MEIGTIAAWGEFIGGIAGVFAAIGVIATLIYLGRQISQSVGLARASQNQTIQSSWEQFNNSITTSLELADLLANLAQQSAELSARESIQSRHLCYRLMNICASAQYAYTHDQISAAEFENHKDSFTNLLDYYPGLTPFAIDILERFPNLRDLEVYASIRHQLQSTEK